MTQLVWPIVTCTLLLSLVVSKEVPPLEGLQEAASEGELQYQMMARESAMPRYGECYQAALKDLHAGCKELTDEVHSRVALSFTNCHVARYGWNTYPCEKDQELSECMSTLDNRAASIYSSMLTNTLTICQFLQAQVWHNSTYDAVTNLRAASDAVSSQLTQVVDSAAALRQQLFAQLIESTKSLKGLFGKRNLRAASDAVSSQLTEEDSTTALRCQQLYAQLIESAESLMEAFGKRSLLAASHAVNSQLTEEADFETALKQLYAQLKEFTECAKEAFGEMSLDAMSSQLREAIAQTLESTESVVEAFGDSLAASDAVSSQLMEAVAQLIKSVEFLKEAFGESLHAALEAWGSQIMEQQYAQLIESMENSKGAFGTISFRAASDAVSSQLTEVDSATALRCQQLYAQFIESLKGFLKISLHAASHALNSQLTEELHFETALKQLYAQVKEFLMQPYAQLKEVIECLKEAFGETSLDAMSSQLREAIAQTLESAESLVEAFGESLQSDTVSSQLTEAVSQLIESAESLMEAASSQIIEAYGETAFRQLTESIEIFKKYFGLGKRSLRAASDAVRSKITEAVNSETSLRQQLYAQVIESLEFLKEAFGEIRVSADLRLYGTAEVNYPESIDDNGLVTMSVPIEHYPMIKKLVDSMIALDYVRKNKFDILPTYKQHTL